MMSFYTSVVRSSLSIFLLTVVSLAAPAFPAASADLPKRPWTMALAFENDAFAGTDRYYTNGAKFAFATPDLPEEGTAAGVPAWLQAMARSLSPARSPADRRFASIFFGQEMYTPVDLWRTNPAPGDRPYAGFLYAGLGFHRRSSESMNSLTLFVGVVGPASLDGAIQRLVHKTFNFDPPLGWANQLKNEPVLGAAFDRKWKVLEAVTPGRSGLEIIGHAGGALSNAFTEAAGGFLIRAGWGLPSNFGTVSQRPGFDGAALRPAVVTGGPGGAKGIAFYAYAALDTHAVLRDIFLDGNSFRQSLSVERIPLAGDVTLGVAFRARRFELRYAYTYRTRRFVGERKPFVIGSLSAVFDLGR
jgi:lipid A 3-O-deacylase